MIKWRNPFVKQKPVLLEPGADKSTDSYSNIDDALAQAIQSNINTYYQDK
jgi:hypothetical protein